MNDLIFQQRLARLQALLEASRRVHSTIELDQIISEVLRIVVKELEILGARLTPAEKDGPAGFYGDADTDGPEFPLPDKSGKVFATLRLYVPGNRHLKTDEIDFVEGLVLQTAIAIQNAMYHRERLKMERLQRDLDTARQIQQGLLPQEIPNIEGYSLAFKSEPCYEVGGDYLDIISAADGTCMLVVADVAGKGLSSALIASSFRAALHAIAPSGKPLAEIAVQLNDLHENSGEEARKKYMTSFLCRLDPIQHSLEIVNAGHNPGILVKKDKSITLLKSGGTPIGMFPGMTYESANLEFPTGTTLVLYTDGITEARKSMDDEEEFGEERLLRAMPAGAAPGPSDTIDAIWKGVTEFEAGGMPCDDKTLLVLKRNGR